MNHTVLSFALITTLSIVSCSHSNDSCSDLEGPITHTTTEITGIESALNIKRSANSNIIEAVDQFNGTEFSNLIIDIELSWIDEQHRFRENNTFFQSFLDWFISPVMAYTLAPYYGDSNQKVEQPFYSPQEHDPQAPLVWRAPFLYYDAPSIYRIQIGNLTVLVKSCANSERCKIQTATII